METKESIVTRVETELSRMRHPRTADIRAAGAAVYRGLEDHSIDSVLALCEQLLNSGNEALKTIAFDWAYRQRKRYSSETFPVFESWLFKYIHDWGDCDDYCTHAFGALLLAHPELSHRALSWTGHERFSVRRAAAVVVILPIRRKQYDRELLFRVADTLLYDEHYLVLKGYGWMLKVLSEQEPTPVIAYLRQHRDDMPRVAFRYALEKLPKDTRAELMKSSGS